MSPGQAALRFLLELAALGAAGWWGWTRLETWPRWVLALGIPLAMATMWGVFNVPGDPSRSGNAPVRVPGSVRLVVEMLVLGAGGYAMAVAWRPLAGIVFAALIVFHYALTWDRVRWLLQS